MDYEGRIKAYRLVAYSSVSFALVALMSVAVGLSMLQQYVAHVGTSMDRELTFCQVRMPPKSLSPCSLCLGPFVASKWTIMGLIFSCPRPFYGP